MKEVFIGVFFELLRYTPRRMRRLSGFRRPGRRSSERRAPPFALQTTRPNDIREQRIYRSHVARAYIETYCLK